MSKRMDFVGKRLAVLYGRNIYGDTPCDGCGQPLGQVHPTGGATIHEQIQLSRKFVGHARCRSDCQDEQR